MQLTIACFLIFLSVSYGYKIWKSEFPRMAKSNSADDDDARDTYTEPLVKDTKLLSGILGDIIKRESSEVFEIYQKFCDHAFKRAEGDNDAMDRMINCGKKISPEDCLGVTRALTQTLNLVNAAEVHHRIRLLRQTDMETNSASPLPMREDSVAGTIENILQSTTTEGSTEQQKNQIYQSLLRQNVEIVFTAHPTEVNRRTLLRKYRSISEILAVLDRRDLSAYEVTQINESLRRQVGSIWGSDEIRRNKPTPQEEARGGLAIIESVLWDAVPAFLRKLDAQCIASLNKSLPMDHVPIKFASWMGGDRDGNPNVTPTVTHEVATMQRLQAARLFKQDVSLLYSELAICKGFSPELVAMANEVENSPDKRELYRRVIGHLQMRLDATIEWCEAELVQVGAGKALVAAAETPLDQSILKSPLLPMLDSAELAKPLHIMHQSLCKSGYADVADGLLIDIIRKVAVFGLTMAPLDLRQESTRHTEALDAISRYLGIGSYANWDEQTKINWLQNELSGKRPFFRTRDIDSCGFSPTVLDTLRTIEMVSSFGPGSLGAYVISQARSASDVLAVMLLQKQFGMTSANGNMMRVVPLFETLDDLTNAPDVMATLFSLPNYLGSVKGKQEVMIGYSDSAKDAGRLSACWAQYESQEKMVNVASKFAVELTFFHGKGGTVGRGGNPALFRAVLAHPPNTINGRFRVTEQGEMITQNFGSTGIAERTMDIYTAAVLAEKFVTHVEPKPEWREQMDRMSKVSCEAYRSLIQQNRFIKYFRQATPELELGSLNIGSRPAKRNPKGGIESLRAIPWTFAWTQTRLNLPAWFGVGDALDAQGDAELESELANMYAQWPFFREMIDLIAMTLSKTDVDIAANYENQLVDSSDPDLVSIGAEIRSNLQLTRNSVLAVTRCEDLSNGFKLLQRSMKVRYPYVDPLNILQAEIMRRLRSSSAAEPPLGGTETDRTLLEDSLVVSINGVAQGMKNSG